MLEFHYDITYEFLNIALEEDAPFFMNRLHIVGI